MTDLKFAEDSNRWILSTGDVELVKCNVCGEVLAEANIPHMRSLLAKSLENISNANISLESAKKLESIAESVGSYELAESVRRRLIDVIRKRSGRV